MSARAAGHNQTLPWIDGRGCDFGLVVMPGLPIIRWLTVVGANSYLSKIVLWVIAVALILANFEALVQGWQDHRWFLGFVPNLIIFLGYAYVWLMDRWTEYS